MDTREWTFHDMEGLATAREEILEAAQRQAEEHGVSAEEVGSLMFKVRMVLEEVLVNHLKHGNQMDPSKAVTCSLRTEVSEDAQRLVFESADEGEGFDADDVPDPTLPENMERASGRGVYLIRQIAERVDYLEKGNKVRISMLLPELEHSR